MYLLDTNVISELRKQDRANLGVRRLFAKISEQSTQCFISVITMGELRRGVELIRHRSDGKQAAMLEVWLQSILDEYADYILDFTVIGGDSSTALGYTWPSLH
jgi:predicted nucleic acid-binding protein